ncbi:hypothetical protein [Amycolatopsis sp. FDAARGOS 1241]|uniref:hypothetical protein n=1 Tax=Amycolatopsis sp. FDAARGOS 1241 TaxID=2778070 RepID=UPI00351C7370
MITAVRDASPDTHPHVAAAKAELVSGAPEERLSWAFRALIAGIVHAPPPLNGEEP